jgi:uncharacterized membrane protein
MALNLVQHRADSSVWDRSDDSMEWDSERWLVAVLAGAFLVTGFRRRSWPGLALVLGGGALAWWAAAGVDQRQQQRGRLRAAWPSRTADADLIGEASEQSFPASDAPSWTPTTGNTPTHAGSQH